MGNTGLKDLTWLANPGTTLCLSTSSARAPAGLHSWLASTRRAAPEPSPGVLTYLFTQYPMTPILDFVCYFVLLRLWTKHYFIMCLSNCLVIDIL